MEKMCWTDRAKNEEGLHKVKGERIILLQQQEERLTWLVTTTYELEGNTEEAI